MGCSAADAVRRGGWAKALALIILLGGLLAAPQTQALAQAGKAEAPASCLGPGQQALAQRDFPKAIEVFSACAKQQPKQAQVYYWLGMAHFLAHQPAPAVEAFSQCLKLDPQNPAALGMLGKLYSFDKDKLAEAEELLGKALKVRPDWEDARLDLARVYALTGRYDQSFKEFNLLFRGEVRFALYHTELGKILLAMGLTKEAGQEFKRALALQPGFTPAQDQLKALEEKPPAPSQDQEKKAR